MSASVAILAGPTETKEKKMRDLDLLARMAQTARGAAALMPVNTAPVQFDSWPGFKAAFDAVDLPLAAFVRENLEQARPDVPVVEEIGTVVPGGEAWVIDATDGAVQYLQGLPQWSVSIGLIRDGRPVLSALFNPLFGELYTAAAGQGAFRDGVRVFSSVKTDLSLTLAGTSQPPFPGKQPAAVAATAQAMTRLLPEVGAIRNLGPTSWQVADVASGRVDVFWEFGQDAANLLAASLVAAEAGAVVSDAQGRPWDATSPSFVAAPPVLHARFIAALADVGQE
jgi:myo-inositol-1(or 4)-monophosphatase